MPCSFWIGITSKLLFLCLFTLNLGFCVLFRTLHLEIKYDCNTMYLLTITFCLFLKKPVPVFFAMHYTCTLFSTLLDSFLLKKVKLLFLLLFLINSYCYYICLFFKLVKRNLTFKTTLQCFNFSCSREKCQI